MCFTYNREVYILLKGQFTMMAKPWFKQIGAILEKRITLSEFCAAFAAHEKYHVHFGNETWYKTFTAPQ